MDNEHLAFFKSHATKHTSLFPMPYGEIGKHTFLSIKDEMEELMPLLSC